MVIAISKDVRTFLEERSNTCIAMTIAIRIFTENFEKVMEKCDQIKGEMLRGTLRVRMWVRLHVMKSGLLYRQFLGKAVSLVRCLRKSWDKGVAIGGMVLRIVIEVKLVVEVIFCVLQLEKGLLAETSISEEGDSVGEVHVGEEVNLVQKEDGGTVATVRESFEDFSLCTSEVDLSLMGGSVNWCGVVNGTRYFGHLRSGSSFGVKWQNKDAVVDFPQEAKKERNRRLLLRDREMQAGKTKMRRPRRMRRNTKEVVELQLSERGHISDKGGSSNFKVREEKVDDGTGMAKIMTVVQGGEVERFLRRKLKLSCGAGRTRSCRIGGIMRRIRKRGRKKKRKRIRWRGWRVVRKNFTRVVKWYSCSAVRYARLKSNRRYKPGD